MAGISQRPSCTSCNSCKGTGIYQEDDCRFRCETCGKRRALVPLLFCLGQNGMNHDAARTIVTLVIRSDEREWGEYICGRCEMCYKWGYDCTCKRDERMEELDSMLDDMQKRLEELLDRDLSDLQEVAMDLEIQHEGDPEPDTAIDWAESYEPTDT